MNKINSSTLGTRAKNVLAAEKITTIEQLRKLTYIDVLKMPYAGRKVASEIMEFINTLPKVESDQTADTCRTCRYFLYQQGNIGGVCRRYPPVKGNEFTEQPDTYADNWCGEHKL